MAYKAILKHKSHGENNHCVDYNCGEPAKFEAISGNTKVLCCKKASCQLLAIKTAIDLEESRKEKQLIGKIIA